MDSRKVLRYLKQYGQQQSFEAIRDNVDTDVERGDLDRLVEEGKLVEADGGVDGNGNPIKNYAAPDTDDDD
jgi:hypothetical protein